MEKQTDFDSQKLYIWIIGSGLEIKIQIILKIVKKTSKKK